MSHRGNDERKINVLGREEARQAWSQAFPQRIWKQTLKNNNKIFENKYYYFILAPL